MQRPHPACSISLWQELKRRSAIGLVCTWRVGEGLQAWTVASAIHSFRYSGDFPSEGTGEPQRDFA